MIRLLYIVSHPIQYQAPLLRRIAREPGIQLKVLFEHMPDGAHDPGFGQSVRWDVPLLDGYEHARLTPSSLYQALRWADAVWVHGWQGMRMKMALVAAALAGRPILMRGENWLGAMPHAAKGPDWLKRAYLRRILALCQGFMAIGSDNRDYYLDLGLPPDRIFPMPYAVDNATFTAHAAAVTSAQTRRALGLPEGRPMILFAGKLMARKHPHTLMAAWRLAFADAADRPFLVYVGNGELAEMLKQNAEADVHFLGFRNQSELPAIYATADVFVLAAEREAWGLAINEAMACGTAVIASSECGASRDLIDNTVGAVVPPGDPVALASALRSVVAEAAQMGAQAQARIADWGFKEDVAGLRTALDVILTRDGARS